MTHGILFIEKSTPVLLLSVSVIPKLECLVNHLLISCTNILSQVYNCDVWLWYQQRVRYSSHLGASTLPYPALSDSLFLYQTPPSGKILSLQLWLCWSTGSDLPKSWLLSRGFCCQLCISFDFGLTGCSLMVFHNRHINRNLNNVEVHCHK